MARVKVPEYARNQARKGLQERKRNKAGLTKKQADKLGISSGVQRAKQLITNSYISNKDAKAVARFYQRFQNCKTDRCETALKLWGGRMFGKMLENKFYG